MNVRKFAATAVLVIAAMGVTAGTSNADPAPAEVKYESSVVGKDVVTTLEGGFFSVTSDGKAVEVKDTGGHALVSLPLAYNVGDLQFPLTEQVSDNGTKLSLTAVTDVTKAVARPGLHNVASVDENQRAMGAFSSQLGIAMAIGGLSGLTVGAIVGCVFGLPLLGVGCIPGIPIGAGVGSIIGTIAAGGPTLVVAGIDLINTLNAPPGTSKFAPGR